MVNSPIPEKKIAIFDLDGTLIDSDKLILRELIETFRGLGVSITEEEANIGGKRDKYTLAAKHGFSKEELDRSFRQNVKGTLRTGEVTLYPETLRTLDSLRDNEVMLGALSRATRKSDVDHKVQHFGLDNYFGSRIVVVHEDSKYHGAVNLLKKMQSQHSKVYCIGDRAEDVVIADDLREKNQIDAEGIYVHRLNSPDPNLTEYKKVKTLDEIPELVLRE